MSDVDVLTNKTIRFLKLADEFGDEEDNDVTPRADGVPPELFKFFWDLKRMVGNITGAQYMAWIKANENVSIYNRPFLLIEQSDWDYYYHHKAPYLESITGNRNKRIRIYPSKTNEGDIKEVALLHGSSGVPNLWIYVGDFSDKPLTQSVGKELGHNFFIWEAFQKGMYHFHPGDPRKIAIVSDFVNDNKEKINSLRKWFTKTPEFLGAGVDGSAFDVGNYVLKIFSSASAYKAAMEAWTRLHKNPDLAKTEAMIYDVGQLGECAGNMIYYYVMEKMSPVRDSKFDSSISRELRPLIRGIAYKLMHNSYLKKFKKNMPLKDDAVIKKEVSQISTVISDSFKNDYHVEAINEWDPSLKPTWLPTLVEEIAMKFLTNRNDLHTGNIGVTNNGEFRYFDPAYGEGEKSKIHLGGGSEV